MKIQPLSVRITSPERSVRERPVRPDSESRRGQRAENERNYRQLYNRVVNSNLDRSKKAQLIERIKNAAAGEHERPERDAESIEENRRRTLSVA